MFSIEQMKADAEACNKRNRRLWGVSNFVSGQSGVMRKQCERAMGRREKVWAMYATGMTMAQIAQETGLTLSTVKSDIYTVRLQNDRDAS